MSRRIRLPAERLREYLLDVPHPRTPRWRELAQHTPVFSWKDVFGNDQPVEIEVGFGKGMFLTAQSLARPGVNFLGIEIERKYVMATATRIAKHAQLVTAGGQATAPATPRRNVRLACTDARWLLQNRVAPGSVQAVHIFFPDPWWKQRHRKRKVFTPEFAACCAQALTPQGILNFASDVEEYFQETCAMVATHGQFAVAPNVPPVIAAEYLTHFERKYRLEGRTIYRMCWRKTM